MPKKTKIVIKRLLDSVNIPNNINNNDWHKHQILLKKGNKPEPEFTTKELKDKKQADIKMKESEYEKQLKSLRKEHAGLVA